MLIGIVALMFLGPRKLPEMAKKIGKIMAEFRSTTSEFKETWQREVNFEEEAKALDIRTLDAEPIERSGPVASGEPQVMPDAPAIKEADPAKFEHLKNAAPATYAPSEPENDKKNWL